ncbi:MAG: exodeoxyribonuclease VII small subunit [Deltaproteobacteria bacterium]|nr:exodeoxyribonuclease VII small subunit [Deltaproteobacteria bacterium]
MNDKNAAGTAPMDTQKSETPNGDERFDELLDRLRKLVGKLESGNLNLEDSLRCFEEGVVLCKRGTTILDSAEKRVDVLLARTGGTTETTPLDPGDEKP